MPAVQRSMDILLIPAHHMTTPELHLPPEPEQTGVGQALQTALHTCCISASG